MKNNEIINLSGLSDSSQLPRHLSVKDTASVYRWPIGGLRWLVFNAKQNGLDRAIRKVGRKVLIDRFEFEKFIDSFSDGKSYEKK